MLDTYAFYVFSKIKLHSCLTLYSAYNTAASQETSCDKNEIVQSISPISLAPWYKDRNLITPFLVVHQAIKYFSSVL